MALRILFVANHAQPCSADDEGAVAHALTALGHTVICLNERTGRKALGVQADLCLSFKWLDPVTCKRLPMPRVFWWFDMIHTPLSDRTLAARSRARQAWMAKALPLVDLGFCTDATWIAEARTLWGPIGGNAVKLHWLPQGADERVTGRGEAEAGGGVDVLLTGISRGGGAERESFVAELRARYGPRFRHVERGVYGRDLANLIASAKIVVAPDSPVTDDYWSCRIFHTLGFGAFLLHPWCARLTGLYRDREEVVYYRDRKELFALIDRYLEQHDVRRRVSEAGLARTQQQHLYRHRVAEMLEVCRDKGVIR